MELIHDYAKWLIHELMAYFKENFFILICPMRGLNLDLWDLKPVRYQLSHPCLFQIMIVFFI